MLKLVSKVSDCIGRPSSRAKLSFEARCAACTEHRKVATAFKAQGIIANGIERRYCNIQNCFRPRWWDAKFCTDHTKSVLRSRHFGPHLVPNITTMRSLADNLTDAWRLCDQSVCNTLMQNFLNRGASREQRWVCLDIETINKTRRSRYDLKRDMANRPRRL